MHRRFALLTMLVLLAFAVVACSGGAGTDPTGTTGTDTSGTDTAQSGGSGNESAAPETSGQSRLQTVLDRGELICGINSQLPGFSFLEEDGTMSGFDADFCRVIAAVLFDDPNAVSFRPLSAAERFAALQTGEIDVLIRNTTWTLTRDTSVGGEFAPTTFYDGQGMMVRADSGVTELADLVGASICVTSGTTTELVLADSFRALGVDFTPATFEETDAVYTAYEQGNCDAVTSDKSQLASRRTVMADPAAHVILDVTMSKEPLGPVVTNGDSAWFDAVKWSILATIQAEEFGMTSSNIDEFANSENPDIRRFLGLEGDLGQGMGLANDFAVRVVKHVGNYGQIYARNLGPETPLNIPRALNELWTRGGLMYSPPFR